MILTRQAAQRSSSVWQRRTALAAVLVCGLIFSLPQLSRAQAQPPVVVLIDGKVVQAQSARCVRGRQVMIWVRDLEKLGWGSVQVGQPQQVMFKSKNVTLTFVKGQSVALVNSLAVQLPVETYVSDGRLMVPLSFVAKALGYRYATAYNVVVQIITSPGKVVEKGNNAIRGQVVYDGAGVKGIVVRAADADFTAIQGAVATTDDDGHYRIENLPDADYMAYVYIDDNPAYISRASETIAVSGGRTLDLQPISLVLALTALKPKVGQLAPVIQGVVKFAWTPCKGAVSYRLDVKESKSQEAVAAVTSDQAASEVPADRFIPGVAYEARVTALGTDGKFLGTTARAGGITWTFTVEDTLDTVDT